MTRPVAALLFVATLVAPLGELPARADGPASVCSADEGHVPAAPSAERSVTVGRASVTRVPSPATRIVPAAAAPVVRSRASAGADVRTERQSTRRLFYFFHRGDPDPH